MHHSKCVTNPLTSVLKISNRLCHWSVQRKRTNQYCNKTILFILGKGTLTHRKCSSPKMQFEINKKWILFSTLLTITSALCDRQKLKKKNALLVALGLPMLHMILQLPKLLDRSTPLVTEVGLRWIMLIS
jgi:hypothetical protein